MIATFYRWLHGRWPAGKPENLPAVGEHGRTDQPGVYIAGDLTGIPLLKLSLQSGADAVRDGQRLLDQREGDLDVAIIGAGVAGMSAAAEADKLGLSYAVFEASQPFSTIANFPKRKPIYTYPTELNPESELSVAADVKEDLLKELEEQVAARGIVTTEAMITHVESKGKSVLVHTKDSQPIPAKMVVIAIGRSGNYRKLGVPGEELDKVSNRLHDPAPFAGKHVLVVGGGDSACETAISIAELNIADPNKGSEPLVTLSYRKPDLSRPKPGNVEKVTELAQAGKINLQLATEPKAITDGSATIATRDGNETQLPNDAVFAMIGREAPLDFFRRSKLRIHGERSIPTYAWLLGFLAFSCLIYGMKAFGWFGDASWNPVVLAREAVAAKPADSSYGLWDTIVASISNGFGFFITLLYCSAVVGFGIARILRRKTPYVKLQTTCLMLIQCLPLFILPEIILPYMGHQGAFDSGVMKTVADELFPAVGYDANGREYWRAYGFILAWPLFVWNVFTAAPLWGWLIISLIQTFVIIPLIVWRWGKGAYCGWICSCGALAETMGDTHREKMPHGPLWNKVNMIGQVLLWLALVMVLLRVVQWSTGSLTGLNNFLLVDTWKPVVDYLLAGALGVGLYFWYSGRTWCRFACPLAALMHIYARFSRFRITVDHKKCISCNACTSVCHQGIDIMNFANKGNHMEDPECVRCSACVQTCPTGVLQFGRVDADNAVIAVDKLAASPVLMREQGQSQAVNT